MEKRRFVRQPLDLLAWIIFEGGSRHACQIKDFSLGGVFVFCSALKDDGAGEKVPSMTEHQLVELEFEAAGTNQHYRIPGRLKRVLNGGIAVEFVNPDPATLLVMQELANKVQKTILDTQAQEAVLSRAAGGPETKDITNRLGVVETLKELVRNFFKQGLDALFVEAKEKLFETANKAGNPVQETECMDAIKELDNVRSLIEQSFLETLMEHLVKPGYAQLAGPESPQQAGGELTLVDPEKFQDWLRMKRILEKAGPKYQDTQHELHARLSAVSSTKIDEFNNPIGLPEICASFYDSVQELGASRVTREAVFDALEDIVVAKLGRLYAAVNEMFISKGILPTVEPPKHVIKKNPRSEAPKSAHPSAAPGAHQAPPSTAAARPGTSHAGAAPANNTAAPSSRVASGGGHPAAAPAAYSGGGASSPPPPVAADGSAAPAYPPSNDSPATASSTTPAPATGTQPATAPAPAVSAPAAHGAAASANSATGGPSLPVSPAVRVVSSYDGSPPAQGQVAVSAPRHGVQPSRPAYRAVHTLLGLQRQADGTGAPPAAGSAHGAGAASESPGPSYARNEIMNALSSVQHQSGTEGVVADGEKLKERIRSTLETQQPTGTSKQIGEQENAAIELTTGLVDSIVEDMLVSDEIRSQFRHLQIPLLKAAMSNEGFFSDPKHPARKVVDQLGALSIPEGEIGSELREKVNQVVNQIASMEGDGESEFSDAAGQLDALLKDQIAAYEKNVIKVVDACEHQEEITQTRRKDGSSAQEKQQTVPVELKDWFERAGRVQVGDRVTIDKGGRTHHETLAWVSGDRDKYVFVDGLGEKASSMIRQQLAMLLKRGLLKVLAENAGPATDRGMHMVMRKMHEDLATRATHDPTTGLLNQKAFLDRVNRAVTDAVQNSAEHVLCYLDLDHFGEINKKWGETAGDKLLGRFGVVLKKNMGDKGVTARLPEDEFGLVLYGCSHEKGSEFADRLRRAISSARCYWKGESLPLSVSIGVAPITKRSESVAALIKAAKSACVEAKKAGRDCVKVIEPDSEKIATRALKHEALVVDKILEGDRLALQAQRVEPIGEDADGKPHYEITMGLRNLGGELVPPDHFIRAAERSNRVSHVDRWVVRTALEWMAKNKRRLLKLGGFAINLSGVSLNDGSLTDFVMDQFMKTKVPPGKVIFEVTETAAIERLSTAEEFLRVMKDFGCRFTLDDFGTGDSSYDYLQQLAVDFVKIDGMFVKELETSASDYAMVKSITEIGHCTGKKTIAEEVENEATLNKLKEIGVDFIQGSLVEEPKLLQELR